MDKSVYVSKTSTSEVYGPLRGHFGHFCNSQLITNNVVRCNCQNVLSVTASSTNSTKPATSKPKPAAGKTSPGDEEEEDDDKKEGNDKEDD